MSLDFILNNWLRALRSVVLLLGLYIIIKLNCERNSAYQTQHWFSCLVVINIYRFLQSVMILNGFLVLYNLKYHSFKALIIAKNFLLQILQLYFGVKYFIKKNATSFYLLLLLYQERILPEAQFNISIFTTIFFVQL